MKFAARFYISSETEKQRMGMNLNGERRGILLAKFHVAIHDSFQRTNFFTSVTLPYQKYVLWRNNMTPSAHRTLKYANENFDTVNITIKIQAKPTCNVKRSRAQTSRYTTLPNHRPRATVQGVRKSQTKYVWRALNNRTSCKHPAAFDFRIRSEPVRTD